MALVGVPVVRTQQHTPRVLHEKAKHLKKLDFQCPHCDYKNARKAVLKRHIAGKHEGFLVTCDYPGCSKSYDRKGNLDAHKKKVHGIARPNDPKD